MSKTNFIHLWPTIIGRFYNPDHVNIKDDLLIFFKEVETINPKGMSKKESLNLYESPYDLHTFKNNSFKKLINFFQESFLKTSLHAYQATVQNKDLNENSKFKVLIKDSWFIDYNKGGSVLPHNHGNCSWCCVYYVDLGGLHRNDEGNTYFLKPYTNNNLDDFGAYSYDSFSTFSYKPKEGEILIWPSHLMHGTVPSTEMSKRIIVSANSKIFKA